MEDPRLDSLLWSLRLYKTRSLAADACRAGKVSVSGVLAKPGRNVHPGEVVQARLDGLTRTVRINALPRTRVSAALVGDFMTDLTPQAEYERARQAQIEHALARKRGLGRPSKKDRRDLERIFGDEAET